MATKKITAIVMTLVISTSAFAGNVAPSRVPRQKNRVSAGPRCGEVAEIGAGFVGASVAAATGYLMGAEEPMVAPVMGVVLPVTGVSVVGLHCNEKGSVGWAVGLSTLSLVLAAPISFFGAYVMSSSLDKNNLNRGLGAGAIFLAGTIVSLAAVAGFNFGIDDESESAYRLEPDVLVLRKSAGLGLKLRRSF